MHSRIITTHTTFAARSCTGARFCATAVPAAASIGKEKKFKLTKGKGTLHPSNLPKLATDAPLNPNKVSWFTIHRDKTIKDLAANDNDKSNAGRVDPLILSSVELINSYPHYVTASSCSGRVSVFHRAMPVASSMKGVTAGAELSSTASDENIQVDIALANKKRGTGIGTVFSSHDPLSDTLAVAVQVYKDLVAARVPITRNHHQTNRESPCAEGSSAVAPHALAELLQVKFEPTILHTTCETMSDAHRFIAAASESGHRTTGIVVSRAGKGGSVPTKCAPTSTPAHEPTTGSSAEAADEQSTVDAVNAEAVKALEGISDGWKITAKMQSMVCFDAPLYTATSGWLNHGGHSPLPNIYDEKNLCTAEEKRIGEQFIASVDRLLQHGNALFVENVARRERFNETLRQMEALAAKKKE